MPFAWEGFRRGFGFLLLLRWSVPQGPELPARLFTTGMLVGLLGVVLIGVRERWQFADLLDFSTVYRITASFSSMHTGDAHLPAYLALAVPFVWLWVVRLRPVAGLPVGLVLFSGAIYLVVATVTRASVPALTLELASSPCSGCATCAGPAYGSRPARWPTRRWRRWRGVCCTWVPRAATTAAPRDGERGRRHPDKSLAHGGSG